MDTPEPPAVWLPAPTIAPPEAERVKPFKLRLALPEWANYWAKAGFWLAAVLNVCSNGYKLVHPNHPTWCRFEVVIGLWFISGGIATAWKYRLKKNKE